MWVWIHKCASPKTFYCWSGVVLPYLAGLSILLFSAGLVGGLVFAPADYQQGDSFRIMYIHVPAAIGSLGIYMFMAICGLVALVWRIKLGFMLQRAAAPIGACYTFLALVTGAIWGKPTWGAWWVWDARLTSELILLFLYIGYIALQNARWERLQASRAGAVLVLLGVVNIPIIHYSVTWWHTLHQGPSLTRLAMPTIARSMLYPLLLMIVAFGTYFATVLLMRARLEVLRWEQRTTWVKQLFVKELA